MKGREGLSLKILFTESENTSEGQIILKGFGVPGTLFLCCCSGTGLQGLCFHCIPSLGFSDPSQCCPQPLTHRAWCTRGAQMWSAFCLPPFLEAQQAATVAEGSRADRTARGRERQIKHPTKSLWTEYQPCIADLGWEPTIYQAPPGLWGMAN